MKQERKGVEDYLMDYLNAKYAKRIFQVLNTEYEGVMIERGDNLWKGEYEWMVNRALELYRGFKEEKTNIPSINEYAKWTMKQRREWAEKASPEERDKMEKAIEEKTDEKETKD